MPCFIQFLETGDYELAAVLSWGECAKLSKNRKKKLKAVTKNAAVVGNVSVECKDIAAAAKLKQEMEVVQSKVVSTLFHIDIYAIAGKSPLIPSQPNNP